MLQAASRRGGAAAKTDCPRPAIHLRWLNRAFDPCYCPLPRRLSRAQILPAPVAATSPLLAADATPQDICAKRAKRAALGLNNGPPPARP